MLINNILSYIIGGSWGSASQILQKNEKGGKEDREHSIQGCVTLKSSKFACGAYGALYTTPLHPPRLESPRTNDLSHDPPCL